MMLLNQVMFLVKNHRNKLYSRYRNGKDNFSQKAENNLKSVGKKNLTHLSWNTPKK